MIMQLVSSKQYTYIGVYCVELKLISRTSPQLFWIMFPGYIFIMGFNTIFIILKYSGSEAMKHSYI